MINKLGTNIKTESDIIGNFQKQHCVACKFKKADRSVVNLKFEILTE